MSQEVSGERVVQRGMSDLLPDLTHEFRRHKELADRAMSSLEDGEFFRRPGEQVNPVALVVKHLAGNLRSRWTDLLSSDGEKPDRDRDGEFVLTPADTRASLLAAWEAGWGTLFDSLAQLGPGDLGKVITIRGEPHTVAQALLRGLSHAAYHTGQILYLARWLRSDAPWLTIAPGQSRQHRPDYRQEAG